jgi:transcription-repair coupling factor (superfamily II helicase)
VDIGVSAFIPKAYIPADRVRMDVYRRLTRCDSIDTLNMLEQDLRDAFGEPPRQAVLLMALTELRLLAGIYGIESIIRKEPDVVLTVRDASRVQLGLHGAPGTVRVIDPQTVYLRMPPHFMESNTLLMVLRNLFKAAYEREQRGEPPPEIKRSAARPAAVAAKR